MQFALKSHEMSDDQGLIMQEDLVAYDFGRFSKNLTKLQKTLTANEEDEENLEERFMQHDQEAHGKKETSLNNRLHAKAFYQSNAQGTAEHKKEFFD